MDAIVWDISTADKDDIFGKCVYYIELKKSFIQVNYGLEKLIMDYFNLGITDVNKIFGTWVTSRLPNIIKINEEHR